MTAIMVDETMKELERAKKIEDPEKKEQALDEIKDMIIRHINTCIELDKLKGATNESEISIANVYYEVEGTGKVTLQFDDEKNLEATGIDNYGLKPSEDKIKGTGDIKIITDNFVDKFSLMLECHKEKGFSE